MRQAAAAAWYELARPGTHEPAERKKNGWHQKKPTHIGLNEKRLDSHLALRVHVYMDAKTGQSQDSYHGALHEDCHFKLVADDAELMVKVRLGHGCNIRRPCRAEHHHLGWQTASAGLHRHIKKAHELLDL